MPQDSTENTSLSVSDVRSAHRYSCLPALTSEPAAMLVVRPHAPGQGRPESKLDRGSRSVLREDRGLGSCRHRAHFHHESTGSPQIPRGLHSGVSTSRRARGSWWLDRGGTAGPSRAEQDWRSRERAGLTSPPPDSQQPGRLHPTQPPHFGQDDPPLVHPVPVPQLCRS